ncbi:galactose oxidase [Algoriphagus aestuariicola]|uniref:Galactose oxidase n=1 Tax=Algoriphagus aestuariicola TaxID=1852016 RepID=A0ABS3BLR0_9BACT|nr:kelch repeat-containing protein [Algoriphagus aestuariicola]MBN7799876.1 galactose oxidase [Algoriphagus aestuariicola]
MKSTNQLLGFTLALTLVIFSSCVSSDDTEEDTGNWIRRSYFEGSNRANSSAFTIDGRHFIVGGYTGDAYLNDLWEYDPNTDAWTKRADFPGTARGNAVAFTIDGIAYYGTGYDGRNRLSDFWSYDPANNSWNQIESFPGTARYNALAFGLNGRGYVGTGFDGSEQKDFFQYDPGSKSWTALSSFGGAKRQGAFCFVLDGKAYLGGGINNGLYQSDFWALDGTDLTWTQKTALDEEDDYTMSRSEAAAFALGGYGYVTLGSNGQLLGTTWEYIPSLDSWEERTAFEGTLRTGASVFYANDRAFVLLGRNSSLRFDDIYEFRPFEEYDEED